MKKILFAACMLFAVSTFIAPVNAKSGGSSQDIVTVPASQVPSHILTQFHNRYAGATNVQWEVLPPAYYGSTLYRASFKFNGAKMKVYFN